VDNKESCAFDLTTSVYKKKQVYYLIRYATW